MFSPDNQKILEYHFPNTKGDTTLTATNWFVKPGTYKLSVGLSNYDTLFTKKDMLKFNIGGNEFKINVSIDFKDSVGTKWFFKPKISSVYRYYLSSDSITLEENWTPKSDGFPRYIVHNNSRRALEGNTEEYYPGWNEIFDNDHWIYYERGRNIEIGFPSRTPILPGNSILSEEGINRIKTIPFRKGRYKYCTQYLFYEPEINAAKDNSKVVTVKNIYLLEKEFEIKVD